MKKNHTEDILKLHLTLHPTPLPHGLRSRLLGAIQETQVEARAVALQAAPLRAGFHAQLLAQVHREAQCCRRRRYVLRLQYGAAACVVLCSLVGSLFCVRSAATDTPEALFAVTSHSVVREAGQTIFQETVTIAEDDNTVLRVRVPLRTIDNLSDDVI